MEKIPIQSLSADEKIDSLRRHALGFAGYALAMAERAGLTPEQAGATWLEPVLPFIPRSEGAASPEEVRAWVRRNAASLEMYHDNVRVEHEGDVWTMVVSVGKDRADLERWGSSLEYWAGWMAVQTGAITKRYGFRGDVRLNGEELRLTFQPG